MSKLTEQQRRASLRECRELLTTYVKANRQDNPQEVIDRLQELLDRAIWCVGIRSLSVRLSTIAESNFIFRGAGFLQQEEMSSRIATTDITE
jgi:thiamine pyrophosphate-dependent acetolactate synthase large subunit-like protein